MSWSAISTCFLNTSRDGDSTTSLGSLLQCVTTLSGKKFFLISNHLNLPWCNLRPFPLALSLITWEKRPEIAKSKPCTYGPFVLYIGLPSEKSVCLIQHTQMVPKFCSSASITSIAFLFAFLKKNFWLASNHEFRKLPQVLCHIIWPHVDIQYNPGYLKCKRPMLWQLACAHRVLLLRLACFAFASSKR